jgi:choline dehydrogenase-like flavoprotein
MARINGASLNADIKKNYDAVIIGSGPAGASCGAKLAEAGLKVAIVEEGDWVPEDYHEKNLGSSFTRLYRDSGTTALIGTPPVPYLQGKAVGGSSVINGAISWQLPRNVYQSWIESDSALEQSLPWEKIDANTRSIEQRLNIHPTPKEVAGPRNLLMEKAANTLGLENRPISRNVSNCQSSSMCLHSCPNQAKQSMDNSYLLDAEKFGADIYYNSKAERINTKNSKATGVICSNLSNYHKIELNGKRIVLAASAIQSPVLLLKSKIKHGPVGKNFQCHPGISVSGIFPEEIHNWRDATQGHEVIGLRKEGIKFESAAMDISVFGMRMPGTGEDFMLALRKTRHCADWAAAIKSKAKGSVHNKLGQTLVTWSPASDDMILFRKAAVTLGKMFFSAGAETINFGVHPYSQIHDENTLKTFEHEGSLNPKDYSFAHKTKGLYIADSSVFPSNTGVNPQTSIIALAQICASHIVNGM